MTTKELKNKLIGRINLINDEDILNEVYRLIDDSLEDSEIFLLSENHKQVIEEAKSQIDRGEVLTNEQANKEISIWLKK